MSENKDDFPFHKQNYIILGVAVLVIMTGFLLMMGGGTDDPNEFTGETLFSFQRITLAPIMVLAGFGLTVYAIMKKPKA